MINVVLYGRSGCHLCDQAKADLETLQGQVPHNLIEIDIDSDSELRKKYNDRVPVVKTGPYELKAPFTQQELQVTLNAARHREEQIESIDRAHEAGNYPSYYTWTSADGFSYWLSRRYLLLLNLLVLVYLGLPFLAPVLMKSGVTGPANLIYRVYGSLCHQMAFRSFFLFGEQTAYPRQQAEVPGLIPYETATGLPGNDQFQARQFVGNEAIGYKIALCQRDVSIYGAILFFGLLFFISGRKIPPLPWYLWVLVGMVPIGLDGVSQLLSQPPLNLLPYRESTPFLRVLTGGLFGFATAWFGYPMVEETMADSRLILEEKLARIRRKKDRQSGEAA